MLVLSLIACGPGPGLSSHDVAEGTYWVYVPDGVDPAEAPALFHLHANGLAERDATREGLQADLAAEGLVGVFPAGWGPDASTDWNVGDNRHDIPRDDVAFLLSVAADLEQRYAPASLWLGGASKGGAMTFELACLADDSPFAGFLPMSGAIEKSLPGPCTHPPRPIRHLQGEEDDDHWPLHTADRPTSSHMGIIDSLQELTTTTDACLDGPSVVEGDCETWTDCAEPVTLCWHPGGHRLPGDWVHRQAEALRTLE